ncbi:MAG TPA: hypothetical protein DCZ10_05710 [Pelotomaculum sp.]|nr:hypothetical protein [Pelotomaculum sp.]
MIVENEYINLHVCRSMAFPGCLVYTIYWLRILSMVNFAKVKPGEGQVFLSLHGKKRGKKSGSCFRNRFVTSFLIALLLTLAGRELFSSWFLISRKLVFLSGGAKIALPVDIIGL